MSLLLDALQRASKEKAAALPARPSPELSLEAPAEPPPRPAAEPLALVPASTASSTLTLEPATAEPTPSTVADTKPQDTPAPPVPPVPPPAAESSAPSSSPASTPPARPEPAAPPGPRKEPTLVAPPSAQLKASTARDILNARSPAASPSRKRTLALAAVGALAGLLTGSVFLGMWDSLLAPPASLIPPQAANTSVQTPASPEPSPEPTPLASSPEAAPPALPTPPLPETSVTPAPPATSVTPRPPAVKTPESNRTAQKPSPHTSHTSPPPRSLTATATPPDNRITARRSPAEPPSSLETGYRALNQGRYAEATQAYRKSLQSNPDERDALLGLAYIAHHQGNRDEARNLYQRVLRTDPDNATAHAGLLTLTAESDPQEASAAVRDLSERHPRSASTLATLGGVLAREGRLAEAQQAFFKAATIEPNNPLYAYNLAVALDRLHKPAQAADYYTRALRLAEQGGIPDAIPRTTALQRLEQLRSVPATAPLPDPATP